MDRNSLPQKPNTFYNQEALTNINNYIKDDIFDGPQANFNKKYNPESWQNSASKTNFKRSETAPEAMDGSNRKISSFEIETLQIKPPKQTSGAKMGARNLIFDMEESQQNDNRKEDRLGALVEAHNFISKFEEIVPTMNANNNFSRILDLNNSISTNNHYVGLNYGDSKAKTPSGSSSAQYQFFPFKIPGDNNPSPNLNRKCYFPKSPTDRTGLLWISKISTRTKPITMETLPRMAAMWAAEDSNLPL